MRDPLPNPYRNLDDKRPGQPARQNTEQQLRQRGGMREEGAPAPTGARDVLSYMDQGSFLGLRALGRGPAIHVCWFYDHPLARAEVEGFAERLAQGFLGRLLQRSPLPFGRARWVGHRTPGPVTWFDAPISRASLPEWRKALVELPLDPERGPGWRLAVQPLENGDSALSLVVSHTLADMHGVNLAVAGAIAGEVCAFEFLPPSRRWSPVRIARDLLESLRAMPDVCRALVAFARLPRPPGGDLSPPSRLRGQDEPLAPVIAVPVVQVEMDAKALRSRASASGVSVNTLVAAFTARVAYRMGRVDSAGKVKLVLPISDRLPGDRRANALRSITVEADPDQCHMDPRALQRTIKLALGALLRGGDGLSALFPLIPYVPLWLARRMEGLALGAERPVGCSLVGNLAPQMAGPFGEASLVQIASLERYTALDLERLGGLLFVGSYSIGVRQYLTISGYAPEQIIRRDEFEPCVRGALADLGVEAVLS